jgi:hypothetical protein
MIALVAMVSTTTAFANEAKDDFSLQLRLVETSAEKGYVGPSMTGIARIELFLEAIRATRDIQISVTRPDGSVWISKGRRFATGPMDWRSPGGEPLEPQEPGADAPILSARGGMKTMLAVPLEGADIHEIVVQATGLMEGEPVATEAVVRAPLGVSDNQPVDDGERAHFSLQGVN